MKFFLLVVVLIILALILVGCSNRLNETPEPAPEPEPEEDGYTTTQTDVSAPKSIESTEIISFWCCFSTLAYEENEDLDAGVYSLDAKLNDGVVSCRYRLSIDDTDITFAADASFMQRLQEIVAEYDLAQLNGIYSETKGLPDMYGIDLTVDYASGEWISAYNNEDNLLSFEAMIALNKLFCEAAVQ